MKRALYVLLALLLLVAAVWYFFDTKKAPKPKEADPVSIQVGTHSDVFNNSVSAILDAYYAMSEALVNWDTTAVNAEANKLIIAFDGLNLDELKKDTAGIYESAQPTAEMAKAEVAQLLSSATIDEKRSAFNRLSDNLRLFLVVIKYDREKIYWQECPMAFGDDQPGNWLSKTVAVRNPYLGTKHPQYKAGMLACGGPKDTLNFMK